MKGTQNFKIQFSGMACLKMHLNSALFLKHLPMQAGLNGTLYSTFQKHFLEWQFYDCQQFHQSWCQDNNIHTLVSL